MEMGQEEIDRIVPQMALAGLDRHMVLAKMAIAEPVGIVAGVTPVNE